MTHTALRKKLHQYIDKVEEKKLKAMYTIFEEQIENDGAIEYSYELRAELNKRYEAYKKGGPVVTKKEADKQIKKLLASIKR